MNELVLDKQLATEITWEMVGSRFEDNGLLFEVMLNEQVDSSRWTYICTVVIKVGFAFYEVTYERGLTECQHREPFEDIPGDTVMFYRVVPQEKTVIEYVKSPEV